MVNNGEEVVERKYAEVDDISCGIMYRRDLFLDLIKDKLVSYKTNSFGFNGLIKTDEVVESDSIKYGQPSLDDIMIYYANKEDKK